MCSGAAGGETVFAGFAGKFDAFFGRLIG